jgi:hypothetical protein
MSASSPPCPQPSRSKTVTSRFATVFVGVATALLAVTAVAQARIGTPGLQTPKNRSVVQSLPAFTWGSVGGAATYEFEFSAARNFSSAVNGFGSNPVSLSDTAISNDDTIPNGTYYWRVRAVNAKDVPGRWSSIRKLVKRWTAAAKLKSPVGATVNWPSSPLLLSWTTVAHAVNYQLKIGTSSSLASLVYGPTDVQGPQFAFPSSLAPGTYYWSVQPIDAAGDLGTASAVRSFTWAWPSQTTLTESDVSPDSTYEEPSFSWVPVAGASSYEIQVATLPSYPNNATILDSSGLIGTSYTATAFFPDHTTLYWRLRAIDANGDAGAWNNGQQFTESFDDASVPSIQNLNVYDQNGNALPSDPTATDPILRWSPVPGASDYRLTLAGWGGPTAGCEYNSDSATITTPSTSWAPEGNDGESGWSDSWESNEYGWPGAADSGNSWISILGSGGICVSLIAVRNDSPISGSTIESAPTLMGDNAAPAFVYQAPTPTTGQPPLGEPNNSTYSPGIVPPAAGSASVGANGTVSTTPMFEWQPVANADGYYVVIANAENFSPNSIVTGGYTQGTTWTPTAELNDQSSSYWWEVIPVQNDLYDGQPEYNPENPASYDPQPFNKSSVPPTPVSPENGANVPAQPTFKWQSAQAAVNYTLEISADPTFANPIQSVQTDNTSYTSTTTLPAGKTLYWRVRTNDLSNNLNWSANQTFTHNLPAPGPVQSAPKAGSTIPLLSWSPVTGAVAYNLQITTGSGSSDVTYDTPYMTPAEFLNPGISHLQVQSVFPGGVTSAFSSIATYDRTIPAPGGIHATKKGARIVVTWKTDQLAKEYDIQLSTTTGFGSPVASDITENTAWVPQISAADAHLRLYWRLAAVDDAGNVGAYHTGVFNGRHAKGKAPTQHKTKKKKKH